MIRHIVDWLEERTGLETAIRNFLYEEIPGSSGWHQIFGSIAAFLFMLQAFTGIMLAFNYSPTPGEAYNSLKYIIGELTGGALMRGLHHWGASMMIVVVVLHMCQVAVYGAYKKPREATWMVGVVFLRDLLILAMVAWGFAFTAIREFPPSPWGKLSTALQILAALVVMGAADGLRVPRQPFLWAMVAATVWSGIHYALHGLALLRASPIDAGTSRG